MTSNKNITPFFALAAVGGTAFYMAHSPKEPECIERPFTSGERDIAGALSLDGFALKNVTLQFCEADAGKIARITNEDCAQDGCAKQTITFYGKHGKEDYSDVSPSDLGNFTKALITIYQAQTGFPKKDCDDTAYPLEQGLRYAALKCGAAQRELVADWVTGCAITDNMGLPIHGMGAADACDILGQAVDVEFDKARSVSWKRPSATPGI